MGKWTMQLIFIYKYCLNKLKKTLFCIQLKYCYLCMIIWAYEWDRSFVFQRRQKTMSANRILQCCMLHFLNGKFYINAVFGIFWLWSHVSYLRLSRTCGDWFGLGVSCKCVIRWLVKFMFYHLTSNLFKLRMWWLYLKIFKIELITFSFVLLWILWLYVGLLLFVK